MDKSAEVIFESAKNMGLDPKLLADYGLFEINHNGKSIYFFHGTSYLNNSMSSYLSRNKHFTRIVLEKNNLPNIPFCLPKDNEEAAEFLRIHKKIIAKPTHGDNSIGVRLIEDIKQLKTLDLFDSIIEKYIEGEEFRTLILNGEVIALHKYIHKFDVPGVKRISYEKSDWDPKMLDIALRAAKALDLNFVSVDFIKDTNGNLFILEINSSTGLWRFHHPDEGPIVDVSKLLISATIEKFS